MKRRICICGVVVFAVWSTSGADPAAAAATAINGRCGMHIGKLIRRSSGGSLYKFRVGPRYLGSVRPGTCRGEVRVNHRGKAQAGALAWQVYSMTRWNEHNSILIAAGATTIIGCNAVAKGLIAGLETLSIASTDGLAYPGATAVAGAVGCGLGARELWNLLPDGPDTLNKVRMVK